jgi:hypothetical protein
MLAGMAQAGGSGLILQPPLMAKAQMKQRRWQSLALYAGAVALVVIAAKLVL